VDLLDRLGGAQTRPDPPLQEQPQDVALTAGDLLAHDHDDRRKRIARVLGGPKCALDRVVVGDRDHIEAGLERNVVHHLHRGGPPVAERGVDVEVG